MRPEARAAMLDVLDRLPGNPSGQHSWARDARRALDDARDQVAEFVGCRPGEIVFTSGGTEADNLAIRGVTSATGGRPLCLATDHHAVIESVRAAGGGLIPVEPTGIVDMGALGELLDLAPGPRVTIVSVALANNEVGTIQPLDEVAAVVRGRRDPPMVHIDAVAAAAWVDLTGRNNGFDLVAISGHKVGGPKGIGALAVRSGVAISPMFHGGGQERELRAGTQNVAGAVALGAALAATAAERSDLVARTLALRERLERGLAAVPGIVFTSELPAGVAGRRTVPHVVHLCIPGVEREELLFLVDRAGVAASAGSSCASGALEPSHVLTAMGVSDDHAAGALRLSLGWSSTDADVDHALAVIPAAVEGLTR